MDGILLPATIALGLGISTISILAVQTVAQNSSQLAAQHYGVIAREAAQAGVAQARACIGNLPSTPPVTSGDNRCAVSSPVTVVNDTSNRVTSTYITSQPVGLPSAPTSTFIITVTGVVKINGITAATETARTLIQIGAAGTSGVIASKNVIDLSTGPETACIVAQENPTGTQTKAYCWGSNRNGLLGNGWNFNGNLSDLSGWSRIPIPVAQGTQSTQVSNSINRCGWGYVSCAYSPGTSAIPDTQNITKISVGTTHACAIAGGKAYCWGNNNNGQLGRGGWTSSDLPVAVSTSSGSELTAADVITDISAGNEFTCALTSTGLVYCWGRNDHGQLGNDSRTDSTRPVSVSYSLATAQDCVRKNSWGSCIEYRTRSASALAGKQVSKLARLKNSATMCAITNTADNNRAVCWGQHFAGQTGYGGALPGSTTDSDKLRNSNPNQCNRLRKEVVQTIIEDLYQTSYDVIRPIAVQSGERFEDIFVGNEAVISSDFTDSIDVGTDHNNPVNFYDARVSSYVIGKTTASSPYSNRVLYWGGEMVFSGEVDCKRNSSVGGSSDWSEAEATITMESSGPTYPTAPDNGLQTLPLSLMSSRNAYTGMYCAKSSTDSQVRCDRNQDPVSSAHPGSGGVVTLNGSVIALDTGLSNYSCAVVQLSSRNTTYCWGVNDKGQLGDGTTTSSPTPQAVNSADSTLGTPLPPTTGTPPSVVIKGF